MPLQNVDCNSMDITPEPKCRRGIFKIPSQPVLKRASSFLKRPERPKDSPSPIMKKKARSISVASPNPQADVRRIAKVRTFKSHLVVSKYFYIVENIETVETCWLAWRLIECLYSSVAFEAPCHVCNFPHTITFLPSCHTLPLTPSHHSLSSTTYIGEK